jgi:hypothetical protein
MARSRAKTSTPVEVTKAAGEASHEGHAENPSSGGPGPNESSTHSSTTNNGPNVDNDSSVNDLHIHGLSIHDGPTDNNTSTATNDSNSNDDFDNFEFQVDMTLLAEVYNIDPQDHKKLNSHAALINSLPLRAMVYGLPFLGGTDEEMRESRQQALKMVSVCRRLDGTPLDAAMGLV